MEKVLMLKNEIELLLQDYREKSAQVKEKEAFVETKKNSLSEKASIEKQKIKVQFEDLKKDIQEMWYKVKEQCRKAKLSFNVDEFKSEHLKVNEEDPLSTINTMFERFESEMQGIQSAYDVTPMTAFNANGLIYLIQRYLSSDLNDIEKAYWGDERNDPEAARALDEIREIENLLADIIDQIFVAYAELKEEVDNINNNVVEVEGQIYRPTRVFASRLKLVLGTYRHIKQTIKFNLEDTPLELEELPIYADEPYELIFGDGETNEAMMFVIDNKEIRESFTDFMRQRIKDIYPEDALEIVEDLFDLDVSEESNVIAYNIAHSESPTKLSFALLSSVEELDKNLLKGQAFIVLIVNQEDSEKYKESITYTFNVSMLEDKFKIIDSSDNEIKTR